MGTWQQLRSVAGVILLVAASMVARAQPAPGGRLDAGPPRAASLAKIFRLDPADTVLASGPFAPVQFAARPGETEFSGRLIVKPVSAPQDRAAKAYNRLAPAVLAAMPDTGEVIISVGQGIESLAAGFLLATGDYDYVTPDWRVYPAGTPNDPLFPQQWQNVAIKAPLAWDLVTGSDQVTIAIVDSGIDRTHPDIAPSLVSGYNSASKLTQAAGGVVDDISGHGTSVAGCAAARGNNAIGVAGVSWMLKIMPVRAQNSPGTAILSDVLAGARWAADNGARVINCSYSGVNNSSVLTTAQYVAARNAILVFAAGNGGSDLGACDWPEVVIVGSVGSSGALSTFSNFGSAIDLVAPGESDYTTTLGSQYGAATGTSFSAPIVTGALGLVWSLDPTLPAATVRDIVTSTCTDLGTLGEDTKFGAGRVDLFAAVVKAWRLTHALPAPFIDDFSSGSLDPARWPVRGGAAVMNTIASGKSASYVQLFASDAIESNAIMLASGNAPSVSFSAWSDGLAPAESLQVEYLASSGAWKLLAAVAPVPGKAVVDYRYSLPPDALWNGLAVRFRSTGNASTDVWAIGTVVIGTPCLADIDRSGFVDADDFNAFLSYFLGGSMKADVDGSGFVDFDDMNAFSAAFTSGC